jgi:superkiller protein 3
MHRAILLAKMERYAEAVVACDQVIQLKADNWEAWAHRGDVLQKLQRNQDAISSYGVALEIKPDYYEALMSREELRLKDTMPGKW